MYKCNLHIIANNKYNVPWRNDVVSPGASYSNCIEKNWKKCPWMKAEGFPQMQLWKLTHVHVISEISDKTVLKGAKWSSCSQQSCQRSYIQLGFWEIVIAKLIFRRRTRQFWEFLCSNLSRSCCRQQSQSCRVVVGTAFLAGNLTRSSTEFRKILIRVNCDLPWVQALPCFCTVSLFGLQD